MKKLLSAILILSLVFALFAFPVNASDKVTIEFCVGDSTLSINGQNVTVEKPYVVGVGVTLVPLRVITEAFGATVEWIGETKSINLTYPDVNIHLQIDNPVAEVNGKAQELLSAPELTNSVTMVPLRFISETFGATVSYDSATAKITVVKEASSSGGSTLEGAVTNKHIGDSYYGWSMENPTGMTMDERRFDGGYTSFSYDEDNYIEISVYVTKSDYDFETDYVEMKGDLDALTLVKADKDVSDPNKKKIHLQARSKSETINIIQYVIGNKIIYVFGKFENSDAARKDEGLRIMDTFECSYTGDDIYDLSNVKNGIRKFESETLGLTIDVPADFYESSSTIYKENEHQFFKFDPSDYISGISISVFSKSETGNAKSLANSDFEYSKNNFNNFIVSFYPVTAATYTNFSGYQYNYDITANNYKARGRDFFFELGEYVYNINVQSKIIGQDASALIDSVLNSVTAKTLDPAKTGVFIRNISESTGVQKIEIDGCSFEIPNNYEKAPLFANTYLNPNSSVYVQFEKDYVEDATNRDTKTAMEQFEKEKKRESGVTIVQPTTTVAIHGRNFYKLVTLVEKSGRYYYCEYYAYTIKDYLYQFVIAYPELAYSKAAKAEVEKIIYTFEY